AEALHFLCLDELLFEALPFRVVEKIDVKIDQLVVREISDQARDDINRVAISLRHFQLVPIDHSLLAHRLQQIDPVLPAAEEGKEIRCLRFLRGIESKDADDSG